MPSLIQRGHSFARCDLADFDSRGVLEDHLTDLGGHHHQLVNADTASVSAAVAGVAAGAFHEGRSAALLRRDSGRFQLAFRRRVGLLALRTHDAHQDVGPAPQPRCLPPDSWGRPGQPFVS